MNIKTYKKLFWNILLAFVCLFNFTSCAHRISLSSIPIEAESRKNLEIKNDEVICIQIYKFEDSALTETETKVILANYYIVDNLFTNKSKTQKFRFSCEASKYKYLIKIKLESGIAKRSAFIRNAYFGLFIFSFGLIPVYSSLDVKTSVFDNKDQLIYSHALTGNQKYGVLMSLQKKEKPESINQIIENEFLEVVN